MKNETHSQGSSQASTTGTYKDSEGSLAYANPQDRLIQFLESTLEKIGYELVAIETINGREKVLRVYVDLLQKQSGGVGIEDCVTVTRALDEPLDANPDIEAIFNGPYELEVSSPGIDRPLRKLSDYEKFKTHIARLHLFRPLTTEESGAETYTTKNPKQKNYYGILRGYEGQSVLFGAVPEDGTLKPQKGKKKINTEQPLKNETLIRIPHELISKANLEGEQDELK